MPLRTHYSNIPLFQHSNWGEAPKFVLTTSLPATIDVEVMISMAARVHVEAAPVITTVNLEYLKPYLEKDTQGA
jgi:hypothetical protein